MSKKIFLFFSTGLFLFSSCNTGRAKINNDLEKYFDSSGVEGCFSLLNNQTGDITICNMGLDTQRVAAGTSFYTFTALTGIQAGKIVNETTTFPADSSNALAFTEAFRTSSVPYFRAVAQETGKDTLQLWADSIGYGNKNIPGIAGVSWPDSSLKISADEQLGLMNRLYFDHLPFQKYAQEMVRHAMLRTDNTLYKLSYATGTAEEGDHAIGWVTGWIEENRHVYFFVTLAKGKEDAAGIEKAATRAMQGILTELGFFKGRK